ncbi:MAG: glycosyltransferase family 9 protein [Phycisphaerales bacterium]|nr:glycosyltransferase family 9 protein [Phycisphaerales bacterium]
MRERILVVLPSWVGDVVMATPALRLLRERRPEAHLTALLRPDLAELLEGSTVVDAMETGDARGLFGPFAAGRQIRRGQFHSALLLTNSFSTALATWLGNVPRRVGYDRDGRGPLLTDPLLAPRDRRGWQVVPAVRYYVHAVEAMLGGARALAPMPPTSLTHAPLGAAEGTRLELALSPVQESRARAVLERGGVVPGEGYALLNPGGNNPAKRWPTDRFAQLADHLSEKHGLRVLVNGSPSERAVVDAISGACRRAPARLTELGMTLGALKGIVRGARLMVTNDTGPRHIAAAFGVPLVSLFGPTDPRWTTIPVIALPDGSPGEVILIANRDLPVERLSNDEPANSRIERISVEEVVAAVDRMLGVR